MVTSKLILTYKQLQSCLHTRRGLVGESQAQVVRAEPPMEPDPWAPLVEGKQGKGNLPMAVEAWAPLAEAEQGRVDLPMAVEIWAVLVEENQEEVANLQMETEVGVDWAEGSSEEALNLLLKPEAEEP
jgi:hypothetical protein